MANRKIEDGKTAFQRWYEKNKEAHNAKRAEKYRTNAAYRKKQIKAATDYRKRVSVEGDSRDESGNSISTEKESSPT